MEYFRAYAALTEEQSGFSLPGKKAFGKAVIDVRGTEGKLLFSAQGLKSSELYKIYFVAKNIGAPTSRYSGVYMADLRVNDKGAGEVKITFDATDVGGSGYMIGLFGVVALLVHNAPTLTAPLVGYINETVFWKNGFEIFSKDSDAVEKHEIEAVAEKTVDEKCEVVEEKNVEVQKPTKRVDAIEEKAPEETQATEVVDKPVAGNPHESFKEYVREYINEAEAVSGPLPEILPDKPVTGGGGEKQTAAISEAVKDKIQHMFRRNARMSPFINHSGDVVWIRISPEHAQLIGLEEIAASELALTAYRRYRHLVLGRTTSNDLILGIPGIYNEQSMEIAKPLGLSFNQCNGGGPVENSYGYWVVHVKLKQS